MLKYYRETISFLKFPKGEKQMKNIGKLLCAVLVLALLCSSLIIAASAEARSEGETEEFTSNYKMQPITANRWQYVRANNPDNQLGKADSGNGIQYVGYNVDGTRGTWLVTDTYTGLTYVHEQPYDDNFNATNTYIDWHFDKDKTVATYELGVDQYIILDIDFSLEQRGAHINLNPVTRTSGGSGVWGNSCPYFDNLFTDAGIPDGEFAHVTALLSPDTRALTVFINGKFVSTTQNAISSISDGHYFNGFRTFSNSDAHASYGNVSLREVKDPAVTAAIEAQNISLWSGNLYTEDYVMVQYPAIAAVNGEPCYSVAALEKALYGNNEVPVQVELLQVFEETVTVHTDCVIDTKKQNVSFVDIKGNPLVPVDGIIELDIPYVENAKYDQIAVEGDSYVTEAKDVMASSVGGNLFDYFYAKSAAVGNWGSDGYRDSFIFTNVDTGATVYYENGKANADGKYSGGTTEYFSLQFNSEFSFEAGKNEYLVADFDVAYVENGGGMYIQLITRSGSPYGSEKLNLKDLGLSENEMSHLTVVYDFAANQMHVFVNGAYRFTKSNGATSGYDLYTAGTALECKELRVIANSLDELYLDNVLIRKYDLDEASDDLAPALSDNNIVSWSGNVFDENYEMFKFPALAVVDGKEYLSVEALNEALTFDNGKVKNVEFKHPPKQTVRITTDAFVQTNEMKVDVDYSTGAYKFYNDDPYHVSTGTDYAYASSRLVCKHSVGSTVYEYVTINKDNCDQFATPVVWFYNTDAANTEVEVVYYVYGDTVKPLDGDTYIEGAKKYDHAFFELSKKLELGAEVESFPVASAELSELWYFVGVTVTDVDYAATDMLYGANVNCNIDFTFYVKKSETVTDTGKVVTINGIEYVAFVYTLAPNEIDKAIRAEFEVADSEGNVYTQRQDISFVDYAARLLAQSDEDTKKLVASLLNYANEAHALFEGGAKMDSVSALLETYADLLVTEELGEEADVAELKDVVRSAALKLNSAPEFVFKMARGLRGTVTFTYEGVNGEVKSRSVAFDSTVSEVLVTLDQLNVYELCGDITITVALEGAETVSGAYNLANYANGVGEDNAFALALNSYAKLAKDYKAEQVLLPA